MNCEQARNQDLVGKYVTGQLPEPEMNAFEEHYFGCDECFGAVQLGQAINFGAAKSVQPPKVIQMPARTQDRPRWIYPLAAAAALVVVTLIGWRAFVGQPSKPEIAQTPPPSVQGPVLPASPTTPAPEPQLLASNGDLSAVNPLTYRPSVMRGGNEDSADRFQHAMQAYLKHDYRQTVAGLASIPVAVPGSGLPQDHVTDAGVQLYLGISQLMLNQDGDAVRSLRRAANYGDTPYLENAGFYLAKGLIRQKQYAAAVDQLERTVQLKGDRQAEAQQLLEQLNQLLAR